MKQTMRIWLALVLALCAGTTAWGYDLTTGTLTNCNVTFTVGSSAATTANEGATVTITVTPNEGYATKGVTVKAYMSTGEMSTRSSVIENIEVTQDATNPDVFTFTMPKAHIVVNATTTRIIQSSWIQAIADQTYTGSAIKPTIEVKDGETTLTLGTDYTVAYSNNTAAALSTNATAAPTVTITARGETYSDAAEKASAKFTIKKAAATISFANATPVSKKFSDGTYTNTLSNTPAAGTDGTGLGTVAYTSSVAGVATVDATGKVTFVSTGTTTITATVTDGTNYTYSGMSGYNNTEKKASINYTLTVSAADLSDAIIELDQTSFEYDGTEKEPNVKLVTLGSTELNADTDYTVAYANNTEAGTATVTITGQGNYTGEASTTFTIVNDATTGVEGLPKAAVAEDVYYNLNGQRTEKPGKGIYVKGGRKVIVK